MIKRFKMYYWYRSSDEWSDCHHLSFRGFSISINFYIFKYWKREFYINWFPSCKQITLPGIDLIIQKQFIHSR